MLKYKSTDCWKQRFFTVDEEGLSCYAAETADEVEHLEPLFRILIDKIEAVITKVHEETRRHIKLVDEMVRVGGIERDRPCAG